MKETYKLKFDDGRVVGRLTRKQIGILFIYGHLAGNELYQKENTDSWAPISGFPELNEFINDIITGKVSEETVLTEHEKEVLLKLLEETQIAPLGGVKLDDIDKTKKLFQEFKFKKDKTKSIKEKLVDHEEVSDHDKTVLRRDFDPKEPISDKTVIADVRIPFADEEDEEDAVVEEEVKEEVPIRESVNVDDKTEFLNIKDALPDLKKELSDVEREFNKELVPVEEKEEEDKEETKIKTLVKKLPKGKKTKWITAVAFLAIFYVVLFPGESGPGKIKLVHPNIKFPVANRYLDKPKAVENLRLGKKEYAKGNFVAKVKASIYFRESMKNMFRIKKTIEVLDTKKAAKKVSIDKKDEEERKSIENKIVKETVSPAIYWLILAYAEIINDAKEKNRARSIVQRLIKIADTKLITEEKAALGAGIFYSKIGKYKRAAFIIDRYILLATSKKKKGKVSKKLLSYRLHALTQSGKIGVDRRTGRDDAKETFEYLSKQKTGPLEMFIYCAEYLELNERYDEAKAMLLRASKYYKKSAWLILKYTDYAIRESNLKQLIHNVKTLEYLKVERSPVYFARYLELKGISLTAQKKYKQAIKYFHMSLKLNDSDELRSRLAELDASGSNFEKYIILESKIKDLLRVSKLRARQRKWEEAFKYAVEAVDASPNYIPSHLWLSKIQLKNGYFKQAVDMLEVLHGKYPQSEQVQMSLIEAYIEVGRLTDAQLQLHQIRGNPEVKDSARFYSLLGKRFIKDNRMSVGIRNITKGLVKDSLNDEDYYYLAELYYKYERYDQSKKYIREALSLDPHNLDYICLYAKIINITQDANVAIGYLRNEIKDRGENIKLLSQIAIFYYQSGQSKLFKKTKRKVESFGFADDTTLYRFLLRTNELEENYVKVIENAKKISILEPGNLEIKLKLATTLLFLKRYKESREVLQDVLARMPSYKLANYHMAELHFALEDFDEAVTSGASEVHYFPNSELGYEIQGMAQFELSQREGEDSQVRGLMLSKATKLLENSISRNPNSLQSLIYLGKVKYRQANFEVAREYYLRAWELDNKNPEINKQLGYTFKNIGQGDLAVEHFQNYLELKKDAPDRGMIEAQIRVLR